MALSCRIEVKGHLDESWSNWFDGLAITNLDVGTAVLSGGVPDHTAVYGLLTKIRDLGLPLLSVSLAEADIAP